MSLTREQQQELQTFVKGRMLFNEPMRAHTTIKIGGPADVWVEPENMDELISLIKWADDRDIPRMVFGNGSNTLVRDNGIRGMVISLAKFNHVILSEAKDLQQQSSGDSSPATTAWRAQNDTIVTVGAGYGLQQLIAWSMENSLSGLEPLAGIPGTVGGALIMNAGIKEGTIGDVVKSIKYISKSRVATVAKENLEFSYRKLKLPKGAVIVETELDLKKDEKTEIEARINKRRKQRGEVQPLLWPSLGSVFKNPSPASKAWTLIDDAGLRGVRVGGARVANEHANWIINEGNATAKDVDVLIKMIREKVKDKSGISLETEILIVGE